MIVLFNIPKDNNEFSHGCRHDYEYHENDTNKRWVIHNFSNKKWVICNFLKKNPLKKRGNPHLILKGI